MAFTRGIEPNTSTIEYMVIFGVRQWQRHQRKNSLNMALHNKSASNLSLANGSAICCFNIMPSSATLAQHLTNIG